MATKKTTSKPGKAASASKKSANKVSSPSSRSSKPVVPPKPAKKSAAPAKKPPKPAPASKTATSKKPLSKTAPTPQKSKKPVVPPKPQTSGKKSQPTKPAPRKPAPKSAPISKKTSQPTPKTASKPAVKQSKPQPLSKTTPKLKAKPSDKAAKPAPKPAVAPSAKAKIPLLPKKTSPKPAASAKKPNNPAPRVEAVPRPLPPPPPVPRQSLKAKPLTKDELSAFRKALQEQLDLKQENLKTLTGNNLGQSLAESAGDISTHSTHMADHGTDNFARDLALTLAGNRCDDVREIEEAIRRIDENRYGYCELCDKPIGRERLRAHPFARCCILCQSLAEQGKPRGIRFAGPPTIMPPHQDTDATEAPTDPDQSDSAV